MDRTWRKILALFLLAFAKRAGAESPLSLARDGNEFFKQGRYQESIEAYRRALEKDPDEPLIRYNLGTILATDSRYPDAEQILQEAAQAPNRFQDDAWFNLGVARAEKALKDNPAVKEFVTAPKPSIEAGSRIDPKAIDKAIAQFKEAREAFRQAILAANAEAIGDAKYNHEMTQRMIDRLDDLKKLQQEQQQQQQQQQQSPQNQSQDQQNQQNQDQGQNQQQQQQDQQNQQTQGDQQQQQNQDRQQQQDRQKGEESDEQKKQEEARRNNADGEEKKQQQQQPRPAEGEPKKADPMTPGQIDAMRLLNLIEDEKPEQFKKLFEFKGRRRAPADKDW